MKTIIDYNKKQIIAQAEEDKEFDFFVAAMKLMGDNESIEEIK